MIRISLSTWTPIFLSWSFQVLTRVPCLWQAEAPTKVLRSTFLLESVSHEQTSSCYCEIDTESHKITTVLVFWLGFFSNLCFPVFFLFSIYARLFEAPFLFLSSEDCRPISRHNVNGLPRVKRRPMGKALLLPSAEISRGGSSISCWGLSLTLLRSWKPFNIHRSCLQGFPALCQDHFWITNRAYIIKTL